MGKKKKLLFVSLDALAYTDFDEFKNMPGFKRLISEGSYCKRVSSVFPSLTFPSHASIVTGLKPNEHGVIHNYIFDPFSAIPKWNFYAEGLKAKALWDYAKEDGKTVMTLSWPVSAGADIAYSMPEIRPVKSNSWDSETYDDMLEVFKRQGNLPFARDTFAKREGFAEAWFLGTQPKLDIDMISVFSDCIREYEFDIAMAHLYGMDCAKHDYGVSSPEALAYLPLYDGLIQDLFAYQSERLALGEDVIIMIMGDHSQRPVKKAIFGNHALEKAGLLEFENERLKDYAAYLDSCDGMAYIYVKDDADRAALNEKITETFNRIEGCRFIPNESWPELGCDLNADFALIAEEGYMFESGFSEKAGLSQDFTVDSLCVGAHGYLPELKDYETVFFSHGQEIKSAELDKMSLTDILPLACEAMGIKRLNTVCGQFQSL